MMVCKEFILTRERMLTKLVTYCGDSRFKKRLVFNKTLPNQKGLQYYAVSLSNNFLNLFIRGLLQITLIHTVYFQSLGHKLTAILLLGSSFFKVLRQEPFGNLSAREFLLKLQKLEIMNRKNFENETIFCN